MNLKEFRDYFVSGDFLLASDSGSWCWLFYLSRGLTSDLIDSSTRHIRSIPILKIYSDSTPDPIVSENIIISHVLFLRVMDMVNLCDIGDERLKERILRQEIPWGLSQRLIEYYRVLNTCVNLNYSSNLAKNVIRLWRDTLVIGRRKLLVVSDEEIDILEDFRDIMADMLMKLRLEGDDSVRGIRIDEPDYSFL